MRNRFGGKCYRCGEWVAPGTGHFELHKGKFRVQHCYGTARGGITCEMAKASRLLVKDTKK